MLETEGRLGLEGSGFPAGKHSWAEGNTRQERTLDLATAWHGEVVIGMQCESWKEIIEKYSLKEEGESGETLGLRGRRDLNC